ncbi:MAG: methionine adenosyltransferase domain-containing protein, partial [Candidatus Omnitrophica bacterium]|nr:methionine adenosyltransferase domain-containing protein [Candidatus Omnitrophota bacterium]
LSDERLSDLIRKHFDLTPKGIIKQLDLRRPNFQETAAFGHFGRDEFTWEKTDKASVLEKEAAQAASC